MRVAALIAASGLASMGALSIADAQAAESPDPRGPKQARATRVDTRPVMDGRLDEAVWQQADVITDFHQIRPGDGTPTTERTEVYVLYDKDAMYIGARMFDSEPELIATPTNRHGLGMPNDDRFVIILDPFNTGRMGYRFESNLNAMRHDALYYNATQFQLDWNTIWDVATSVDGKSWVAEVEIPFKSLSFDPDIDTWGFNFGRGIRRRGEEVAWVSYNRTYNPSTLGRLTGIHDIDHGLGLEVVPSLTAARKKRFDPGSTTDDFNPSLDVFYRLSPSMNAALTLNTDFSATEVDTRQVNLTRFNLFFPEKRDFFLNDLDLFQFGNIGNSTSSNVAVVRSSRENGRPYFSRRIGLSGTGDPVDINYGGRISGRIGRWNIGTLAIRQDESGAVDATDLFVGRVSASVLRDATVGMIFTHGNPSSNIANTVYGGDVHYLNNRLPGGQSIEGEAWYQQSETPGLEGNDASFGAGLRSPNSAGLRGGVGFKEIGRNFNPALGYVNRSDIRDYTADVGYTRFFRGATLQSWFAGIDAQVVDGLDGQRQSRVIVYRLSEIEASSRDKGHVRFLQNREVVQRPFTLFSEPGRQYTIQPGEYAFDQAELSVSTAGQRAFSGGVTATLGDFYDGKRTGLASTFNWYQSRYFRLGLTHDWNRIRLPQGEFITRLSTLQTQTAFSSTLFWVNLFQYDNVSEEIGLNTRFQWIPKAGQEGFIVLNYNMQDRDKDNRFSAAAFDTSVKFRYTFRF
jgi:hypothetical protein